MRLARDAAAAFGLAALILLTGCHGADVSRAVGARCDEKAECDERCQPPSDAFPGGFCTLSCLDDGDCPSDTRCIDVAGGVCLFPCEVEQDCAFLGESWSCRDEPAFGADDEVTVCFGTNG